MFNVIELFLNAGHEVVQIVLFVSLHWMILKRGGHQILGEGRFVHEHGSITHVEVVIEDIGRLKVFVVVSKWVHHAQGYLEAQTSIRIDQDRSLLKLVSVV